MRFLYLVVVFTFVVVYQSDAQRKRSKDPVETDLSEDQLLKAETSLIEAEKQMILENYAKAYDLFLVARDLNPNDPAVYFKLAEVVVQEGNNEKGLEYIGNAIALGPDNKYYRIFEAEILKSIGRYNDAIKTYEELIERIPDTEKYLFELAILYQTQDRYDKALETYDKAEDFFGRTPEVMREKQRIYLEQNNMKALMAGWDALIESNPLEPELILEYSNVLMNNGYLEEAEERLNKFISNNPDSYKPYILLSELKRKQGDLKQALDYLEKPVGSPGIDMLAKMQVLSALTAEVSTEYEKIAFNKLIEQLVKTHPKSYQPYAFAGDAYMSEGKKDKALEMYRKAADLSGSNFNIWQNIVTLELEQAAYDSLVDHAEQALEYFPNQAVFYFYGGMGHYFKENYRKAVQLLEQGKRYTSDPNLLSVFYGQLGDAYHSLKKYDKSDESYEKALENEPLSDHALNNYSYYLSLRDTKLDKAYKMSSKLIDLQPDNPTYLDTHGWVLYKMGKYEEAEKYLQKAVDIEEDGTILEHYGDVLFKLGREMEALEYWKKAREAGGASSKIDDKISDKELYE